MGPARSDDDARTRRNDFLRRVWRGTDARTEDLPGVWLRRPGPGRCALPALRHAEPARPGYVRGVRPAAGHRLAPHLVYRRLGGSGIAVARGSCLAAPAPHNARRAGGTGCGRHRDRQRHTDSICQPDAEQNAGPHCHRQPTAHGDADPGANVDRHGDAQPKPHGDGHAYAVAQRHSIPQRDSVAQCYGITERDGYLAVHGHVHVITVPDTRGASGGQSHALCLCRATGRQPV